MLPGRKLTYLCLVLAEPNERGAFTGAQPLLQALFLRQCPVAQDMNKREKGGCGHPGPQKRLCKLRMKTKTFMPTAPKAEAGGFLCLLGQPDLHIKFQVSQCCTVRP